MALPNQTVFSGHTLDISLGGVCVLLDDQIPLNVLFPIRFEMTVNGKVEVITTRARSVYGVFASHGGFRVGFQFNDDDPNRTALIKKLAGKKPMVDPNKNGPGPIVGEQISF